MPQSATLPTGGGGGIGNMPTPVKIGLIGGGLGLAFFLYKRMGSGGGNVDSSSSDNAFGIPNTAIMLGSVQQELLDLKGQVGSGDASLADLLMGGFENMGAMNDAQTAAFQQGLLDLQSNVIARMDSNTQSILDSLSARSDALTELINTNSGAQAAAFKAFQDATAQGLSAIAAQHNAEMAAIGALGDNVSAQQQDIIGRIQILDTRTQALQQTGNMTLNQLAGISSQVAGTQADVQAIGRFLGWQFYQIPNRYAAYIPGQSAQQGNVGSSVIGSV